MKRRVQMLRVLAAVYTQWRRFPSHRLGQLISNEVDAAGRVLFYLSDEDLLEVLDGG